MSKPVNLNQARKAKARDAKRAKSAQNAVKFGRSKTERALDETRKAKAARDLDGHRKE